MTSWEEERRRETELKRAVLDALTERVNRSTAPPRVDTRHLPDCAGYRYKREHPDSQDIGIDDEDDDWRDIKSCGDDLSLPADNFVHFYDSETRNMYYVEDERFKGTTPGADLSTEDVSALANVSPGERKEPAFGRPEVDTVLTRLKLMGGQFGPRGYSAWLSKIIQHRFDTESDIPGFSTLCDQCHSILTHSLGVFSLQFEEESGRTRLCYQTHHFQEVFSHHKDLAALRASANAGCHSCSLILAPDTDEVHNETYFLEFSLGLSIIWVARCVTDLSSASSTYLAWVRKSTTTPSTLKCTNTKAPDVRDLARSWLARCLQEDKGLCCVSTQYLPSRLIKITTVNERFHSARLVLKDELLPETQYLTLSHCWGKVKPISLTQQTLNGFRTDIPMSILSKTFRETLQVAVWLGYHYVWIDSLCILQDSVQDWGHEAALMGDIYRHSTCTIAATGARDGNDGLFFGRSALALIECPLFEGKGIRLYAINNSVWPNPLSDRAWAVQERCLSSRTLNFGSDKISWACRRTECSEGPHAHDLQLEDHSFPRLLDSDTDEWTANRAWETIVGEYSACDLTYLRDKWPAFQGLTAEVEKAQNWTIVHGLRAHLLGQDLLWCVINPETGQETIECGEPSWSWLNIKGRVSWLYSKNLLDAKLVLQEPSVPADAGDPTKSSSEDAIQVEACMIDFKTGSLEENVGSVDCTLAVTNPTYKIHNTVQPESESAGLLEGYWCPDTIPFPHGNLRALQICSEWKRGKASRRWRHSMKGLVITEVPDRPGFWRRVGTYNTFSRYKAPEEDLDSEDSEKRTYKSNSWVAWCR